MFREKMNIIRCTMFFIIGILILVPGLIFCIHELDYSNKILTVGEVVSIKNLDNSKETTVMYKTLDDVYYTSKLNGYSSSLYIGKEIEVYYAADNPKVISYKPLSYLSLLFPAFGLIFALIGGIELLIRILKKKKEKKLKATGEKIIAQYKETIFNKKITVNGICPMNIICEWKNPKDGKYYIFKSKNIWTDPDRIMHEKEIDSFPVYYQKNNIKKYIVDIDELTDNIVDLT